MIKAVWYHATRATFWNELGDPNVPTGASASPRACAIADAVQHLTQLRDELHANTVAVIVPDDDSWQANVGGGFSYDPVHRPTPNLAMALETFLAIASYVGLKVIVAMETTDYRYLIDDTYRSSPQVPGAYEWIHSVLDPTVYYGTPSTTDLTPVIGHETTLRPLIGDPRIALVLFGAEWNLGSTDPAINALEGKYFAKWYPFFEAVAHWGPTPGSGPKIPLTGTYAVASPQDGSAAAFRIAALKKALAPTAVCGFECYGDGKYTLANIGPDIATLAAPISPMQSIICEGGTGDADGPDRHWFYVDAARAAAKNTLGIIFWLADAYVNDTAPFDPAQIKYALFDGVYTQVGAVDYPAVPGHWNANPQYDYTDPRRFGLASHQSATYGNVKLTLNEAGKAVAFAFANL